MRIRNQACTLVLQTVYSGHTVLSTEDMCERYKSHLRFVTVYYSNNAKIESNKHFKCMLIRFRSRKFNEFSRSLVQYYGRTSPFIYFFIS